jgi:Protein of unknown function (DUF1236)
MAMHKSALFASTAAALLLCADAATAQMREKGSEEKAAPSQSQRGPGSATGGEDRAQKEPGKAREGERAQQKAEPREKDTQGTTQREKDQPGKGRAQTEPRDKAPKGAEEKGAAPGRAEKGTESRDKSRAEKGTEPRDKSGAEKGTEPKDRDRAQKGTEPRDKSGAEKSTEPKDRDRAQKGTEPRDKGRAEKGTESRDKGRAEKEPRDDKASPGSRVQLSEQQRANLHQSVLKERNVNRATRVNFSINVGTRVPRNVRLAPLPAAVLTIVPGYRNYRYVVVEDRIVIVEPSTYEIVEVVDESTVTAGRPAPGGRGGRLVLTEAEQAIILREVEVDNGGSTLGLGALSEGAEVPGSVEVRGFPDVVVQQVPKVRNHKFFTAEDRVVIVDPQGSRIQLVIEPRR